MTDEAIATTEADVPAELLAEKRGFWHFFTRATTFAAVGIAALLVMMAIFLV